MFTACALVGGVGFKRLMLSSRKRGEIGLDADCHVGLFSSREKVPRYCSKFGTAAAPRPDTTSSMSFDRVVNAWSVRPLGLGVGITPRKLRLLTVRKSRVLSRK